ncbi:MAG: cytochrome c oxidase subunit II [Caldilineaceae bacterium]|nr:cytochrome c oxidase subunit II [Caldilineaceae bacterium]
MLGLGLTLFLTGCGEAPAIFDAAGEAARVINRLWWLLFGLGSAVYVVVMGYLLWALHRRRQAAPINELATGGSTRTVVWGGIIIPAIILLIVYGFSVRTLWILSARAADAQLVVEVIGHQWWWEVRYPEHGVITANEIHIPVGQPVQIKLSSADVIHSFWVPELHGKLDMIPGRTNTFWIEADEVGEFWGLCAEFCGTQHAKMLFLAIAIPPTEFSDWLAAQQQAPPEPTTALAVLGQQIFLDRPCAQCHAIAGTPATGRLGPDLTHLASRRTLAAGIMENNLGNLGGWLVDPQHTKSGNLMPASVLSGEELQALLAYLQTLE